MESTLSADASPVEASVSAAPGVVVAVVVDQPTMALEEVFGALGAQDYPNIQVLVLLTGSDADELEVVRQIVQATLPTAHIRQLGAHIGFGVAANTALRLVEGDSGFFLIMHDDVVMVGTGCRSRAASLLAGADEGEEVEVA